MKDNYAVRPEDLVFFVRSDLVVVDSDPEAADMSNPRGEIYGDAAYVVAEDSDGYRWRSPVITVRRWMGEAERIAGHVALALNARAATGKLPVGFGNWQPIDPCYGSTAYEREGVEAERAYLERLEA